MAAANFA